MQRAPHFASDHNNFRSNQNKDIFFYQQIPVHLFLVQIMNTIVYSLFLSVERSSSKSILIAPLRNKTQLGSLV